MKTVRNSISILFILLMTTQAQAQFFKKLQKKIENKIERKVEEKAERKSEQMMDSVLADRPSKKKKSRKNKRAKESEASQDASNFDMEKMMEMAMNRKPAEYESSYTFDFTTTMEMTSPSMKAIKMTTSYGETAYYIEMDQGTTMITDYKNEAMITLNKKKKTAQAMSLGMMKMFDTDANQESNDGDISIKKTGRTKTIRGYKCDEYLIKGGDFTSEGWFTKDVNFDMMSHAQSMAEVFKSKGNDVFTKKDIGFPIEMTSTTEANEQITMKVLDISQATTTIDLSNYKVSQL